MWFTDFVEKKHMTGRGMQKNTTFDLKKKTDFGPGVGEIFLQNGCQSPLPFKLVSFSYIICPTRL